MREIRNYADGDTSDIITAIMRMDKTSDRWIDPEAAQCLVGEDDYETLRNVWRFVKHNVRYKTDRPGLEVVKSPAALFKMKSGDCKSFSIAEAALLRALGFKGIRYRFASYGTDQPTHVYIVCKLKGDDVILDAVYNRFDAEEPYTRKKDMPAHKAGASAVSGISPRPAAYSFKTLIGLGLIAWAVFR